MAGVVEKVGAVGASGAAWLAGLPAEMIVAVVLVTSAVAMLGRWLLAREATRREAVRWTGAVEVYKAGGDGAAVARGLAAQDHPPEQSSNLAPPDQAPRAPAS